MQLPDEVMRRKADKRSASEGAECEQQKVSTDFSSTNGDGFMSALLSQCEARQRDHMRRMLQQRAADRERELLARHQEEELARFSVARRQQELPVLFVQPSF